MFMSAAGAFKALCLCGLLVGLGLAQTAKPAVGEAADVRPAIFQRGPQAVTSVASPSVSYAQLASGNFHVASSEEVDGMEKTLEQYVVAFESLSLPQVKEVWPDLDQKHTKAYKDVFAVFKGSAAPRLGLQCAVPKVSADTANVECLETVTYHVGKNRIQEAGPAKISIQMRGQSSHWVVQDMKGTG
jgi:hypothetical protein